MSNRIRELRNEQNLTLKELGEKVGLAPNTISQYETGDREPKLKTWQKLADYFDVPVPYLQGFPVMKNDPKLNLMPIYIDDHWLAISNSEQRYKIREELQKLCELLTDDTDDQRVLEIRDNVKNLLNAYASDDYKLATDTDTQDKD